MIFFFFVWRWVDLEGLHTSSARTLHWPKICGNIALTLGVIAKADETSIALYGASMMRTCSHICDLQKICWNNALAFSVPSKAVEVPITLYDANVVSTCSHSPQWPKICWNFRSNVYESSIRLDGPIVAITCRYWHHWDNIAGIFVPTFFYAKADAASVELYGASVAIAGYYSHHWPKICWNIALTGSIVTKADEAPITLHG